jgi:hypothetical protein
MHIFNCRFKKSIVKLTVTVSSVIRENSMVHFVY